MSEPTETEWAWVAGLFEGEGNIAFLARGSAQARIRMTDKDVLERLDALVPSANGVLFIGRQQAHHKDQWIWQICNHAAVLSFFGAIMPWLGARRREKALEAIQRIYDSPGHNETKTHCKYGHPLSGDNMYRSPSNGQRACKACKARHRADYEARGKCQP